MPKTKEQKLVTVNDLITALTKLSAKERKLPLFIHDDGDIYNISMLDVLDNRVDINKEDEPN
jgi:hypothetical protein